MTLLATGQWDFGKVISTACPSWTSISLQAICSAWKSCVLLIGHLRIWEERTRSKSPRHSASCKANNQPGPAVKDAGAGTFQNWSQTESYCGMEIMSAAHATFVGRTYCPVSSQGSTSRSEKKSQTLQQADTLDIIRSREKCFQFFKIWKLDLRLGLKIIVAVVCSQIKDHFSTDLQWCSSERWCWVCRKLKAQLVLLFINTEDSALDGAHVSSCTEWWDSSLAGSFLLDLVLSLPNSRNILFLLLILNIYWTGIQTLLELFFSESNAEYSNIFIIVCFLTSNELVPTLSDIWA